MTNDDYLDLSRWIAKSDDKTVRGLLCQLPQSMIDLANEHWHATGWRIRDNDTLIHEVIPADYWQFLRYDDVARKAVGGGVEYVNVDIHSGPPLTTDELTMLSHIRTAYRELASPSRTAVADKSGYDRKGKAFKRLYDKVAREEIARQS